MDAYKELAACRLVTAFTKEPASCNGSPRGVFHIIHNYQYNDIHNYQYNEQARGALLDCSFSKLINTSLLGFPVPWLQSSMLLSFSCLAAEAVAATITQWLGQRYGDLEGFFSQYR